MITPFYHIIFRACDKVNAVNKQTRPYNLDKSSIIKISFKSLYNAVQKFPHKITVLGDKLSDDLITFFLAYNVDFSNGDYGNDESIRQSIYKALALEDNTWVYFCEDDYLHLPNTFECINNLILQKNNIIHANSFLNYNKLNKANIAIFLSDYPDRYLKEYTNPSYIFKSSNCHWRQVWHTTFSFIIQAKTVKKNKSMLLKSSINANDAYLSKKLFGQKIFCKKLLCLSPMPGLSTHLHINTMTDLVNWQPIVNTYLAQKD